MTRENSNVKPSDIRRSEVRKTNRVDTLKNSKNSTKLHHNKQPHIFCMIHKKRKFLSIFFFSPIVKMMVRAYRIEENARESYKDLILDDHTQCGCECGEELGGKLAARKEMRANSKSREILRGKLPPG